MIRRCLLSSVPVTRLSVSRNLIAFVFQVLFQLKSDQPCLPESFCFWLSLYIILYYLLYMIVIDTYKNKT